MSFTVSRYEDEINRFRRALSNTDTHLLRQWNRRLRLDAESAVSECLLYHYLSDSCLTVEVNESPDTGGPDFLCITEFGYRFYVECKTLRIDTVTRQTGASDDYPEEGPYIFRRPGLTKLIKRAATKSNSQLSKQQLPRVLVVSTFHFQAATHINLNFAETLLIGYTFRAIPYAKQRNVVLPESYEATHLHNSIFLRGGKGEGPQVENARDWLEAIVVIGFGCKPTSVVGILNHASNPLFERKSLPEVPFLKLKENVTADSIDFEEV